MIPGLGFSAMPRSESVKEGTIMENKLGQKVIVYKGNWRIVTNDPQQGIQNVVYKLKS